MCCRVFRSWLYNVSLIALFLADSGNGSAYFVGCAFVCVCVSLCNIRILWIPQPFYGPFSGTARWAGAGRKLLDFMVLGTITTGTHPDNLGGRHSIQTNQQSTSINPLIFTPDAVPVAILPIYPGLGRAQECAWLHTASIVDKWTELVCGVRITTEDSYAVLDVGPELPKERETSPWSWGVGHRKFVKHLCSFRCLY